MIYHYLIVLYDVRLKGHWAIMTFQVNNNAMLKCDIKIFILNSTVT